jgi:hypothetical protein
MSVAIARAPLTDLLLATLAGGGFPVGDSVIPPGSMWSGQPNAPDTTFTPYVVLAALTASNSAGTITAPQADWRVPYLVQSFGVSRRQAETLADRARQLLVDLRRTVVTLGAVDYTVQQCWIDSLGGLNRVDTTDPPHFGQQDTVTVWITPK